MKKKLILIIMMLLMCVPFLDVMAKDKDDAGDILTITTDKTDDLASNPEVLDHSKFSAGDIVNENAEVDGILFAAGNTLNLKGINEFGLYTGNTLNIDTYIEKDLFVAGNAINLTKESIIDRDLYIAGNSVTIASEMIGGNAKIFGSTITLKDTVVGGDVYLNGGTINFENVTIDGELKYNKSAVINGLDKVTATSTNIYNDEINKTDIGIETDDITLFLVSIGTLFTTAVILNAMFPNLYKKLNKTLTADKFFKNIGWGLVFLIAVPIAAIIAMVTILGLGIGFVALGVYALCLGLCTIPAMALFGHLILTKLFKVKDNSYLAILIGVLTVSLFSKIPVVGGFTYFLVMMFGLGLITEMMFKKDKK